MVLTVLPCQCYSVDSATYHAVVLIVVPWHSVEIALHAVVLIVVPYHSVNSAIYNVT